MRREVGGGATYLDENQVFYQVIWNRNNPAFPSQVREIFEFLSIPACNTYGRFGISAEFRAENDIVTKSGKKIAGEGGGDIDQSMVFVGGILLDFDYSTMSRVLKVPDEKFRDKIHKSMEENLTTMKRELGEVPPREEIRAALVAEFEKLLGRLEPAQFDLKAIERMAELERFFTSPEFMFKKRPKVAKGVKIKGGVEVLYGLHKAPGGLIRTAEEVADRRLSSVSISGDFNMYPKRSLERLEDHLEKVEFNESRLVQRESRLVQRLDEFYENQKVESPGVTPDDFKKTILEAKSGS
jgi:lipoate-protein ligase A